MKKGNILPVLYQLASPVAILLLGLVLLIRPDTASALIARILGWVLTLTGVGIGVSAIFNRRGAVAKGIFAVGCVCIGGWLTANPLILAAWIGRVLGFLLAARGLRDVFLAGRWGHGGILAMVTLVVGVILVILPMTTSRLVFRLIGLVIALIGGAMLFDRLKNRPRLSSGGDSNIIDAL